MILILLNPHFFMFSKGGKTVVLGDFILKVSDIIAKKPIQFRKNDNIIPGNAHNLNDLFKKGW